MAEKYCGYALKFISGKYTGNILPLPANKELYIGRGSELDIVLVEDMVSRRHAKIITGDDYVILQDLGSTNGSFVNGERIRKKRLKEGDRILIGTSILRLVTYDPDDIALSTEGDSDISKADQFHPPPLPGAGNSLPTISPESPGNAPFSSVPASNPGVQNLVPPPLPPQMPTQKNAALSSSQIEHTDGTLPPPLSKGNIDIDPENDAVPKDNGPTPPPLIGGSQTSTAGDSPKEPETPGIKPISFQISRRNIQIQAQPSMTGNLSETPLEELFELFQSSGRNGVLAVYHNGREGHIHFRNGNIVSALLDTTAEIPPKQAALRILTWDSGEFALFPPYDEEISEEISEPPQTLIAEARNYREKVSQYLRELPKTPSVLGVPHPLLVPLRELRAEYLDIVQLVYNYQNIDDVLDASPYSELDTYRYISLLFKQGYIEIR